MQQRPYRSLLFVPADKPDWMAKASKYGADAYVLDLEDAVVEGNKPVAREYAHETRSRMRLYHYGGVADGQALAARGYRIAQRGERIALPPPVAESVLVPGESA